MVGLHGWRGWSCTAITIAALGCGPAVDVEDDGASSDADDSPGSAEDGGTTDVDDAEGDGEAGEDEGEADSANDESSRLDLPGPSNTLSGEYLFALSAVIDPAHPFQFHARVVATEDPGGGESLEILLQPLALDVLSTNTPRTPVGDPIPIVLGVDAEGAFEAELPELRIAGAANPITGSDLVATVGLTGSVGDGDPWCGAAWGTVTQPLMLDLVGSTFAFTRLESDVLPDPVVASCQP